MYQAKSNSIIFITILIIKNQGQYFLGVKVVNIMFTMNFFSCEFFFEKQL